MDLSGGFQSWRMISKKAVTDPAKTPPDPGFAGAFGRIGATGREIFR
jgi:hypothetical protein